MGDPMNTEISTIKAKTISEFCRDWNLCPATVYRLIGSRRLRAVKIGKSTRILGQDEAAFAASLPPFTSAQAA
jgi:hypothetical protein